MTRPPTTIPNLSMADCTRTAFFATVALLATAVFATGALAQPAQNYDQVDLSASAQREVDNDQLIAVIYAEAQAKDQSAAADTVNQAINWASGKARDARGIEFQTSQYTTRPVYAENERRITGWIARQSLTLMSTDQEALSKLLGDLQERVALQNLSYALSKASRDNAEDALISEAITRFKERAKLIASELDRPGYRIVHINVGTSGPFAPNVRSRAFETAADARVTAPDIEAGTQTVSVSINGTIELDPAP